MDGSRSGGIRNKLQADATAEIVDSYLEALKARGSGLIQEPQLVESLADQARAVVGDVLAGIAAGLPDGTDTPWGDVPTRVGEILADAPACAESGRDHLRFGVHPIETLRAATTLFEVALPVLARELPTPCDRALVALSRALHEAVVTRVSMVSVSSVAFLAEQLQRSRREERQRIARELHDRVGHDLALAVQSLDLHLHYLDGAPAGRARIEAAMASLEDAASAVGQLAAELRRSVGEQGLVAALRTYLRVNAPAALHIAWTLDGDSRALPVGLAEELYLVLREACRNALRHAHASELAVTLIVGGDLVRASVADDGVGFDQERAAGAGRGGLPSMRDRALLAGGTLTISTAPGAGTVVTVSVPVHHGNRP